MTYSTKCPKCNDETDNFLLMNGINMACDCSKCQKSFKIMRPHDWSPERIKTARKEHKKELLQPYRQGEFSKEYRDAYPTQARGMVKEGVITQKQHDSAKEVWKGDL